MILKIKEIKEIKYGRVLSSLPLEYIVMDDGREFKSIECPYKKKVPISKDQPRGITMDRIIRVTSVYCQHYCGYHLETKSIKDHNHHIKCKLEEREKKLKAIEKL